MQTLKLKLKQKVDPQRTIDGKGKDLPSKDIEVVNVRDITFDFHAGVVRYNFYDEMGPQSGEFALKDVDNIDWDTVKDTPDYGPVLNTYQLRAIHNLPPKLPGAPDYTFDPKMPRLLTPTEVKVPPEFTQ